MVLEFVVEKIKNLAAVASRESWILLGKRPRGAAKGFVEVANGMLFLDTVL
jgi:hypothetical protein